MKLLVILLILLLSSCQMTTANNIDDLVDDSSYYRGFSLDNVLESELGQIHYNLYVPSSYDGNEPYALYFTLPGYQGLYRFGVGANLRTEEFAFTAMNYIDDMIIVAPQLNDRGLTSARQTITLVNYFIANYNIDENRIFANGYSGGGETMSEVMGLVPELFTAYLHCISRWDGDLEVLVHAKTPVYLVIGRNDEYYGSENTIETYEQIVSLYKSLGLSQQEIDNLVVLDVKEHDYYTSQGMSNEHGASNLIANDDNIMSWLFER